MAAAAAIHLMHAAVHAHVHLLPNSKAANIQHKFKSNIELLTGDGIIPFAVELVAKSSMDMQPGKICRVIMEITRAFGSQGMVDGLYHELKVLNDQYLSSAGSGCYENYMITDEYICKKKEGELHACGAACGAIMGGGTEDDIEKLRKFGLYVGMIRGLMMGKSYYEPGIQEKLEEFNGLAFKVLESFRGKKNIELISSLVEPCPSYN
ncbi:hypothetical protein CDL12_28124 [Handroanthus impetiginosus]|uniref:Uncharacterized protein n=1 Tax=Handroanthus impetiginosus TaxID=429701 RepID=A0A2G9G2L8_9LAMI|nr:hypothetical protein CDL12_28124 [Handroanthus impetiginosus]